MSTLPPIEDRIVERPGDYGGTKTKTHHIPDLAYDEFWEDFYARLQKCNILIPIRRGNKSIDPYFGNFGPRFHPITHTPNYFHTGIDFQGKQGTLIYPVLPGIFEYSGFTAVNGKYVVLSHPEIKTDDGYVLWSLYMHLSETNVKFTKYQKMLRELSFHTYPNIPIKRTRAIGRMGDTGDLRGMVVHLHLQLEFRKKDTIVVIDAAQALRIPSSQNKSAKISDQKSFEEFCAAHSKDLSAWHAVWDERS